MMGDWQAKEERKKVLIFLKGGRSIKEPKKPFWGLFVWRGEEKYFAKLPRTQHKKQTASAEEKVSQAAKSFPRKVSKSFAACLTPFTNQLIL